MSREVTQYFIVLVCLILGLIVLGFIQAKMLFSLKRKVEDLEGRLTRSNLERYVQGNILEERIAFLFMRMGLNTSEVARWMNGGEYASVSPEPEEDTEKTQPLPAS